MFGIANTIQDFLNNSMKSWKLELNASGEKLGQVDIRRGIFQGDSLSPLFVLCMVPLTWLGATRGSNCVTFCLRMTQNCLPKLRTK